MGNQTAIECPNYLVTDITTMPNESRSATANPLRRPNALPRSRIQPIFMLGNPDFCCRVTTKGQFALIAFLISFARAATSVP
jgi:hypothetical protein